MAESRELLSRPEAGTIARTVAPAPELIFTPPADILETERAVTLLVDMPGVKADDLEIDLSGDVLTLTGEMAPFEEADEEDLSIEYEIGKYYRQFTISEMIDRNKIEADWKDGVLKLVLPKMEKAVSRKIAVHTA